MAISDTSSMYGCYHPGFGQVVESYGHKQQLLKQYNVEEAADAVHGSKSHMPNEYNDTGKHNFKERDTSAAFLSPTDLANLGGGSE
jgi:hypothetical protein